MANKKMQESLDQIKAMRQKKSDDFKQVFSSPKGQTVLNDIKHMCGYTSSSISVLGDGNISTEHILISEGQRSVWIKLRAFLGEEILKQVEHKGA